MRVVEFMVRGAMMGGDVVKVLDGLVRWFRMLVALRFALVNMLVSLVSESHCDSGREYRCIYIA
jgi:hypothetical protein